MRKTIGTGFACVLALGLAGCGSANQQPDGGAGSTAPIQTTAALTPVPAGFTQCQVCHAVEPGQTLIGPSLAGVYGRKAGSVPGFAYSDSLKALGVTWNEATLDKWLANPAAMAPGTKMAFAGYANPAQRKAVIFYLKTLK